MYRLAAAVLLTCAALLVSGCASDLEGRVEAITEPEATVSPAPGAPAAPASGQCVAVPVAVDGVYRVGEAGTASVLDRGDRIEVADHRAEAGWASRIDDATPTDADVEFRRGFEVVELEVDRAVSGLQARVCREEG